MRTARPRIIAHRGASADAPENTLAAFEKARELGADAVELDVHMTSDGALVVVHDFDVSRTTSGNGLVFQARSQDLRALDAGGWFGPQFAGQRIPLLSEVLALEGLDFEVELKGFTPAFLDAVLSLVCEMGLVSRVEFTSPHLALLLRVKPSLLEARVGLFARPRPPWMAAELHQRLVLADAMLGSFDVVHLPVDGIQVGYAQELQRAGFAVHAADADSVDQIEAALDAGVDQFSTTRITDAVRLARGNAEATDAASGDNL